MAPPNRGISSVFIPFPPRKTTQLSPSSLAEAQLLLRPSQLLSRFSQLLVSHSLLLRSPPTWIWGPPSWLRRHSQPPLRPSFCPQKPSSSVFWGLFFPSNFTGPLHCLTTTKLTRESTLMKLVGKREPRWPCNVFATLSFAFRWNESGLDMHLSIWLLATD